MDSWGRGVETLSPVNLMSSLADRGSLHSWPDASHVRQDLGHRCSAQQLRWSRTEGSWKPRPSSAPALMESDKGPNSGIFLTDRSVA